MNTFDDLARIPEITTTILDYSADCAEAIRFLSKHSKHKAVLVLRPGSGQPENTIAIRSCFNPSDLKNLILQTVESPEYISYVETEIDKAEIEMGIKEPGPDKPYRPLKWGSLY